jgi:hypothetical protein
MLAHGYSRNNYDHCIYLKQFPNRSFVYLVLYVDDILISSRDKSLIDELKAQLNHEFEMKDLGLVKKILGMKIQHDRHDDTLFLSHKFILRKLLNSIISIIANMFLHHLLHILNCHRDNVLFEKEHMSHIPYSNAVGNLMYDMICSRPDLAHVVSMVSRFTHNPGREHWNTVKWILRYLKGTSHFGLMLNKNSVKKIDVMGFFLF